MRAASGVAIDWPHSIVDQEAAIERIDGDTTNTAYVAIALSKGGWLVGALLLDRDKPSNYRLSGGDTAGLLSRLERLRHLGANRLVLCFEAGHDWFRNALIELGISPCIPSKLSRTVQIPHDAALYRLRHKIENMFARLNDWRRVATRYDRCPILSACALAAIVIYWL